MKYKLIALLAASFTMVACGQEKKKEVTDGDTSSATVATSKVATSIAPVVQKFDGKKYTATKIAGEPEYYIMYFTASW